MKSIHAFLKLQADLEALEISFHGERPPLPGSSVLPTDTADKKLPPAATAAAAAVLAASPCSAAAPGSGEELSDKSLACDSGGGGDVVGESGGSSACSTSWSLPCVSVDAEGNSYFCDKSVALGAGTGSGIGALSEMIPTTGEQGRGTACRGKSKTFNRDVT